MEIESVDRLPNITARTLAGRKITFPEDVKGHKTFLVMVFEDQGRYEKAQNEATAWAQFWHTHLSTYCEFYEIPMMDGQYGLLSFWIDVAMRSGLETSKHDQVACFYGNKTYYRHLLEITDLSQAQVFLLDEKGHIVFRMSGAPNQNDKQQVLHLLQTNV